MESSRAEPIGHHAILPPVAHPSAVPIAPDALRPFSVIPTTDLSDAVGRLYTMSDCLSPLYSPMRRVCGTAVTVKAAPGDNWAIHAALSLTNAGHVLVVDWRGHAESCGAGALALAPSINRGLAGVVVDGAWRDIPDLQDLDFPIIGAGIAAFSPSKSVLGEINVNVNCGGVVVAPGDLIVGDEEGVVVVPRAHIDLVAHFVTGKPTPAARDAQEETERVNARVERLAETYWTEYESKDLQAPPR